jgi:hypothetical protein
MAGQQQQQQVTEEILIVPGALGVTVMGLLSGKRPHAQRPLRSSHHWELKHLKHHHHHSRHVQQHQVVQIACLQF